MPMDKKYKSKRLAITIASLMLFVILLFTTDYAPLEIAGGIAILAGGYIGAETIKPSREL